MDFILENICPGTYIQTNGTWHLDSDPLRQQKFFSSNNLILRCPKTHFSFYFFCSVLRSDNIDWNVSF